MVGLHARDATMREIGFWTAPWARGQGVMTAAARLVCRWGFDELQPRAHRVVGRRRQRRARGGSPRRLGFTVEGTCRARLLHRGERLDAWVGGLLRGELR